MNTPPPNQNSKGKIFSFSTLLFLLLLCVYLQGFFQRDLWPPDEIRVAEIAREMKERNSFIPYLNGKPFLEKPFLHYYLVSLSFQAFGENPVAARIPSLFFTFLTFFLLFLMGKAFQKPHWGIWSIFFLGLFQTFLLSSWLAILDNSLTFFTLLSLYGFLRANLKQKEASWFYLLYFLGISGAFLVKGPIGILIPLLGPVIYLMWNQKWSHLFSLPFLLGISLPLFFVGLWSWLLWKEGGEKFLHFYYIENHLNRFTKASLGHKKPIYYYFTSIWGALGPWVVFFPLLLYRWFRQWKDLEEGEKILLFFFGAAFLFLSLPSTKRRLYLLPLLPSLAFIMAVWMGKEGKVLWQKYEAPIKKAYSLLCILFGLTLLIIPLLFWWFHSSQWLRGTGLTVLTFLLVALLWIGVKDKAWRIELMFLPFWSIVCLSSIGFLQDWNRHKSFAPAMKRIQKIVNSHPAALYKGLELHQSLVGFYLKRQVPYLGDEKDLIQFLKSHSQGYVIMDIFNFNHLSPRVKEKLQEIMHFRRKRRSILLARSKAF